MNCLVALPASLAPLSLFLLLLFSSLPPPFSPYPLPPSPLTFPLPFPFFSAPSPSPPFLAFPPLSPISLPPPSPISLPPPPYRSPLSLLCSSFSSLSLFLLPLPPPLSPLPPLYSFPCSRNCGWKMISCGEPLVPHERLADNFNQLSLSPLHPFPPYPLFFLILFSSIFLFPSLSPPNIFIYKT